MDQFDTITLKPEWMRPPCWRWMVSEDYLANPTLYIDDIGEDSILAEAARYKRYEKIHLNSPRKLMRRFPAMQEAFQIYLNSRQEGWKWMLEAYLMTGLSDREIASRFKLPMKEEVIRRYRKVFFDIDSYRHSLPAVTANLLATSRVKADSTGVSDYTWKVFAYVWGAEAFENMFLPVQGRKDQEQLLWLRETNSVRLDAYAFNVTSNMKSTYNEQALATLDTASKYWDIKEEDKSRLKADSAGAFLEQITEQVNMTIKTSPAKKNSVEEDYNMDPSEVFENAG